MPDNYDSPWESDVSVGNSGQYDPEMLALLPGLRIGIVLEAAEDPDRSGFLSIEPFRADLEAALKIPVDLVAYGSLAGVQDGLRSGEIHYAPLSASAFAELYRRCNCVEPLAVPLAADGTTGFRSVVLVRRASPYLKLADLKGARIAVSVKSSTAGRRVPFAVFREQGIEPEQFFSEIIDTGGPILGAELVITGAAEASLGWSSLAGEESAGFSRGTLTDLIRRKIMEPGSLRILWASGPIPHGPQVVRTDVPVEIRKRLRQFLLGKNENNALATERADRIADSFAPIDSSDYRLIMDSLPQNLGLTEFGQRKIEGSIGKIAKPSGSPDRYGNHR